MTDGKHPIGYGDRYRWKGCGSSNTTVVDGHVIGSDILFANRLAPPLRDNDKCIQEAIQLGVVTAKTPNPETIRFGMRRFD
ncbi:hypothetical protein CEXT_167181 [Caerostris extrusa]|uniref:Uncharacterized protein n=1 Tax=Caerostris extrusa TaxID=172846 RepID=A0AAV4TFR9_CAEEX|nr:hypothetical protein CEXT_167181 [Caerostris extrusa]